MKKLIFRILLVGVILVVIALGAIFFSLNSIVKKGVETAGPKLTKVEVRLGGAKLSPLSGNGRLMELFVGNPPGFKSPSAIKVGDVNVGLQLSSVLSDTLIVKQINIQAPEITFEGSLSGNNLSKILDNLQGESTAGNTGQTSKKTEKKFIVKDVLVKGGIVNVGINTPLGSRTAKLSLSEIHLQDIGSSQNGVTAAELAKQLFQPLLASVTKAVTEQMADLGKGLQDMGKGATGQVDKATERLKGLFKK